MNLKPLKAFEVEDTNRRENYSFILNENTNSVAMHNTSRGMGNYLMELFKDTFPFDQPDAPTYFQYLYDKSLDFKSGYSICFIGWVDPATFEPLEDMEDR